MKKGIFALVIAIGCFSLEAQIKDPGAQKGYLSIKASDLSKHLHIIASDEFQGRETSMEGQKKASRYIADHFRSLGLKPIGDDGTYFQHFDVRMTQLDTENSSVSVGKRSFAYGKDYLTSSQTDTTLTASSVFLGFADSYVDTSYNERIAGRIALTFPGTRAQLSDTSERGQMMRLFTVRGQKGVYATIILLDPDGPASFDNLANRFGRGGRSSMRRVDMEQTSRRRGSRGLRLYASSHIADALLSTTGTTYGQLLNRATADSTFEPVFLDNVPITITNAARSEIRQTENVVGLLEGSDPRLKDEVVALTAHYDHLGSRPDGTVYNGADDDGSGTVTILELAEAYASGSVAPKRSILFMTVTGEEKGLLGSGYYTDHPIIPLDKTVTDLNIDMIGRIGYNYMEKNDSMYVYVIGSDKISKDLDAILNEANEETVNLHLDYTYNDENDPNRFYYRSDHYNFAKNGVPVTFFFTGTHPDYHQATDTPDKILYERMAMIARLVFATSWKIANREQPLAKNPPSMQ